MAPLLRYLAFGVLNTALHACAFFLLVYRAGLGQGTANGIAFTLAATLSYLLNSRYTFATAYSFTRYLRFCLGMAVMAFAVGALVQWLWWPPVLTLVVFSAFSALGGYWYSQVVVFRGQHG